MDNEEKIIEFVKNNPCLWKKKDKDFKNNFKRGKLWSALATDLGVPGQKLKGRWKTLRNTFRIEISKNKEKPSGSGASVSAAVKWRFFQQMQFLKNEMISGPTLSNYVEVPKNENITEEEFINDFDSEVEYHEASTIDFDLSGTNSTSSPIPATSKHDTPHFLKFARDPLKQKNTVVLEKKLDDILSQVSKAITNCNEYEQSEIDTFFQSIATKVKNNNLDCNEWAEFQEHILFTINKKLRTIRNNKITK